MPVARKITREELLEKCIELFNRRGYWGVSIKDIAEHTGVAKASVYHYFESKDALGAACIRHALDFLLPQSFLECTQSFQFYNFKFLMLFTFETNLSDNLPEITKAIDDNLNRFQNVVKEIMFYLVPV